MALSAAVKLPTPRKQEPGRTSEGYGRGLAELIEGREQLPTQCPTLRKTEIPTGKTVEGGLGLTSWVALAKSIATPTARDWKSGKASEATMERNSRPLSEQVGGQLNPDWVEWLMGWPVGWTSLEPMTPDAFAKWAGMQRNDRKASWWADEPENVPRVASGVAGRVARLSAIGNGQVPLCAAMAWGILTEEGE